VRRKERHTGRVVGTDIDEGLLDAALSFLDAGGISNVELVVDDLFESKLEPRSFDLLHARYQIAPLGRGPEQVASYRRLVKPGGWWLLRSGTWARGTSILPPPRPSD
jgi:ubiquinone/menaquinone biosynthesis C-methylase UbiE